MDVKSGIAKEHPVLLPVLIADALRQMGRNVTLNKVKNKVFPDLMAPIETMMFLRLDQTSHNLKSACRALNYWRDRDALEATKFARRI